MNKKSILVVSSQQPSSITLQEWAGIAHPYHVNVVSTDEEAIECCHLQQFDLVVVDAIDKSVAAKKLNAVLPILQEDAAMLLYDGESAEKISESVDAIFNAKKYKRILNMILLEPGERKWDIPQFSLN